MNILLFHKAVSHSKSSEVVSKGSPLAKFGTISATKWWELTINHLMKKENHKSIAVLKKEWMRDVFITEEMIILETLPSYSPQFNTDSGKDHQWLLYLDYQAGCQSPTKRTWRFLQIHDRQHHILSVGYCHLASSSRWGSSAMVCQGSRTSSPVLNSLWHCLKFC